MGKKKDIAAIESGAGFIGSLASKLVKCLRRKGMTDEDIYELAREGEASDEMINKIADALMAETAEINKFLKLIPGGESLVLDECDGTMIIAEANDMFSFIDPDFNNWGVNKKGSATSKTSVRVLEMVKDGTFTQMFGAFFGAAPDSMAAIEEFIKEHREELQKRCFTDHQIINFVIKHRRWLRADGYATFFLRESNNNFFVVHVSVDSGGGLEASVSRLGYSSVWDTQAPPSRGGSAIGLTLCSLVILPLGFFGALNPRVFFCIILMQSGKLRGYGFGSRLLKIAIREFRRARLAKEWMLFSK